jgi:hypothetical protein
MTSGIGAESAAVGAAPMRSIRQKHSGLPLTGEFRQEQTSPSAARRGGITSLSRRLFLFAKG